MHAILFITRLADPTSSCESSKMKKT